MSTESHIASLRAIHESPLLGTACPVCATGKICQSGTALRCANCGWLKYPPIPTSRPVMNSPADEAEARDRDMRLHDQRSAPPHAEDFRGTDTQPEARPVSATAHLVEAAALIKRLQRIERHPGWQSRAFQWLKQQPDLGADQHG